MAWEENSRICLHMQLIAILSRIGVYSFRAVRDALAEIIRQGIRFQFLYDIFRDEHHGITSNPSSQASWHFLPIMLFSITFMI